mmetsp:Transcript_29743/g.61180  ORF Transcript_29743/g.61180 Transcript_29743/m.61180 type:complete len:272 (-) Transcript_29743:1484-2299(-)
MGACGRYCRESCRRGGRVIVISSTVSFHTSHLLQRTGRVLVPILFLFLFLFLLILLLFHLQPLQLLPPHNLQFVFHSHGATYALSNPQHHPRRQSVSRMLLPDLLGGFDDDGIRVLLELRGYGGWHSVFVFAGFARSVGGGSVSVMMMVGAAMSRLGRDRIRSISPHGDIRIGQCLGTEVSLTSDQIHSVLPAGLILVCANSSFRLFAFSAPIGNFPGFVSGHFEELQLSFPFEAFLLPIFFPEGEDGGYVLRWYDFEGRVGSFYGGYGEG